MAFDGKLNSARRADGSRVTLAPVREAIKRCRVLPQKHGVRHVTPFRGMTVSSDDSDDYGDDDSKDGS